MNNLKKNSLGLGGLGKAKDQILALKEQDNIVLVNVPLNLIDFDEDQYRKDKKRYKLVELATSIRNNGGLIQNPNYEKLENGRYGVLTGEMRTRAYMYLNEQYPDEKQWSSIPVRIRTLTAIEGLSLTVSRKIFQFTENDQGEKPNLFDRAQGLVDIFTEGGTEAVQIALSKDSLKSSAAEVSKWKSVSKVNEKIREDIIAGEIEDKETIIILGKIADKKPESYRSIMDGFKEGTLDTSLAKSAKETWDTLKKAAGKKVSKAKGKTTKVVTPRDTSQSNEMLASDAHFENGCLVIHTKNGTEMKFIGLDHLEIAINKKIVNG